MKKLFLVTTITAVSIVYVGVSFLHGATDVLKQLGIPEAEARDFVWWSISGNTFSYPRGEKIRNTPVSQRAAMVQQIGTLARQYTESEEFRKKYLELRESRKPAAPEKPEPMEQMRARLKAEGEKSIKEAEANMAAMPAEYHEVMRGSIDVMKEQVKSYDDPENPMFSKEMEKMQLDMYDAQVAEHQKQLAEWEQANPTHPKKMVKSWLEGFLKESKDIDFSAKVVDGEHGKKVFSKREYEMKSSYRKMCYRAGKESVGAARTFTQQWLDDLNKK